MTTFPAAVPFATYEWLPDHARPDGQTFMGGPLTVSRGVVFHVNAGDGDPYNWWTNPTNPSVASAHLQITKTGQLIQYVPLNRVAWAEVDGNGQWHSVETQGFPTEPLTPAQFETFAKLLAWGHTACGWPLQVTDSPTGYGLGTHQMGGASWGGHPCPGPIRAAQRPALIARAQQILQGDDMPLNAADEAIVIKAVWSDSYATIGGVRVPFGVLLKSAFDNSKAAAVDAAVTRKIVEQLAAGVILTPAQVDAIAAKAAADFAAGYTVTVVPTPPAAP